MQSDSGGVRNADSEEILLVKRLHLQLEQAEESCKTRARVPVCACTRVSLWSKPGFELLLCWVTFVSAGGEPKSLLRAREEAPLYQVRSPLEEATAEASRCASARRGWERAVLVSERQALPTGPGGPAGCGLLAAE